MTHNSTISDTEFVVTTLPVSVVELSPQEKNMRSGENHNGDSSRKFKSNFPEETCKLVYELFLRDKQKVFDPFAGFGQRAYWAKYYGKSYIGYDISQESIDLAKNLFGVDNILADSSIAEIPEFDSVFTCPPYFDLEQYSSPDGLDKLKDWSDFLICYESIWRRIILSSKSGIKFCVQVGDWRSKGKYYDLVFQTEKIFENWKLTPVDKVIISRLKTTKIKIMLPQCKRLGYTCKVHESLLVYEKK